MCYKDAEYSGLVEPVDAGNESFILPTSHNKPENDPIYSGIEAPSNRWIELACELAVKSAGSGGGPFGAVIIQVDSQNDQILRYWAASNGVTRHSDPTAHAEITAIRSACHSLGVFHLDQIPKSSSLLPQSGEFSKCILFSSCEPCPMCYGAISWAKIPVLFFSATRFDASDAILNFSDAEIYEELQKPYRERKLKAFKCHVEKASDAFEKWKVNPGIHY